LNLNLVLGTSTMNREEEKRFADRQTFLYLVVPTGFEPV